MVVQTVRKGFRYNHFLSRVNRNILTFKKAILENAPTSTRSRRRVVAASIVLLFLIWFSTRKTSFKRLRDLFGNHDLDYIKSTSRPYFDHNLISQARAAWNSTETSSEPHDHWSMVKNDVVLVIKTGHEVAEQRLKQLRSKGWWSAGRHVPNIIAIGDEDNIPLGVIGIKNYAMDLFNFQNSKGLQGGTTKPKHWFEKKGWRGDKDKNLPALHFMHNTFPGKKWYVLLDDDTYLFLENFAHYILQQGMNTKPIYTGKVFFIARCGGFGRDGRPETNHTAPRGAFAHGGSGIVLNALALDAIFPRLGRCIMDYSSCWAGDMQVGLCMRDIGISLHGYKHGKSKEKNYIPFSPRKAMGDSRYTSRWRSSAEPLTFHKMPEDELESLSSLERSLRPSSTGVTFKALLEHLFKDGIYPKNNRTKRQKYFTSAFIPKHRDA